MKKTYILDCTLRDGGYCNNWTFGYNNIKKIVYNLGCSNADFIECGYFVKQSGENQNRAIYADFDELKKIGTLEKEKTKYVCMLDYGKYRVEDIPELSNSKIGGIRVAFHKSDCREAIGMCEAIACKGYKVFVQPMVTMNYSEDEFKELIIMANEIKPYAVYIVDSFGAMKLNDVMKYFEICEKELDKDAKIGFHSHNNMQLSFSHAQRITGMEREHELIIDSSIFGMGRGAGNLNTELFMGYLNETYGTKYNIEPLLSTYDECLDVFYQRHPWGYSLPNYLSAKYNFHPNYASYFQEKHTLTVSDIDCIFAKIMDSKKNKFDVNYADKLYMEYMESGKCNTKNLSDFIEAIRDKKIVLILPGKSIDNYAEQLAQLKDNQTIIVSINFVYEKMELDYIFISNVRRYSEIDKSYKNKMVITSNIDDDGVYLSIDYKKLLNEIPTVRDNAVLMLLKFLIDNNVKNICIAGLDGYSYDVDDNYIFEENMVISKESVRDKNIGIREALSAFAKRASLEFITAEKYIKFPI